TPTRGRIQIWNVVAEELAQGQPLFISPWAQVIGFPDYVDIAFRTAHEVDPGAKLVYKEFRAENSGAQADGMYNLVKGMIARGVPIDGVSFESHFIVDGANSYLPKIDEVKANFKRFADLGLFVQISEMDVA